MNRAWPSDSPLTSSPRSISTCLALLPVLFACSFSLVLPHPGSDEARRARLTAEMEGESVVEMPLKKTTVHAEVSGFVARVHVRQTFGNPLDSAVEVRYVFPLPERAAVDGFVLEVAGRRVDGQIRRREEAARIYRHARRAGYAAALLEQERPNIFTQSVANIPPGEEIHVELTYVDFLVYEAGDFKFLFPMVVGPRYIPGSSSDHRTMRSEPAEESHREQVHDSRVRYQEVPTDVVQDAARISPPVLKPGFIPSNTIDLTLDLDAGVPLRGLWSPSHAIKISRQGDSRARVRLGDADRLPNKDFMFRIGVASEKPELGLLAHRSYGDGFFALRIQPPAEISREEAASKELIFVLDVSGSMSGLPEEMSRRLMHLAVASLGAGDTFNIIHFSNDARTMAPASLPATPANIRAGLKMVDEWRAGGGTQMLRGLRAALSLPEDSSRHRMILFLSDGYIGNEMQLIEACRDDADGARIFTMGVGSSVNHYLLRQMAEAGRGAYTYIRTDGNEEAAVDRFHDWVTRPYLTDLEIDWGSLAVEDVQPSILPDLYSGQTLTVVGRYLWGGSETVIIRGRLGGRHWESAIDVRLPERSRDHEALASAWTRERIRDLIHYPGERIAAGIQAQVTSLALGFRLMSPFTSFVAVDSAEISNPGAAPVRWDQALPMPEFVSFTGCFGPEGPQRIEGPVPPREVRLGPGSSRTRTSPRPAVAAQGATALPRPAAAPEPTPVRSERSPRSAKPAPPAPLAPTGTGVLRGRVIDSGGVPLPGVPLTIRSASSGSVVKSVVTDVDGNFFLQLLPPARDYLIQVSYPGFASVDVGPIQVEPGKVTAQEVTLRTSAELTEGIKVMAHGNIVDTSSASSSTTFNSEFVQGLPITGRNKQKIGGVAGGVIGGTVGGVGAGLVNMQGARQTDLQYRLDGGNVSDPAGGAFGRNVNFDAVEDVEVIRAGASTEYGRAEGGFAGITTPDSGRSVVRTGMQVPASIRLLREAALRVLADLLDNGRLSRSEGLPALAALVATQRVDGSFSSDPATDALATWALAEVAAALPDLPWVAEASRLAGEIWRDEVGTEAAGDPAKAGPWETLALAVANRCGPSVAQGGSESRVDLRARLESLGGAPDGLAARLRARILGGDSMEPKCLIRLGPEAKREAMFSPFQAHLDP